MVVYALHHVLFTALIGSNPQLVEFSEAGIGELFDCSSRDFTNFAPMCAASFAIEIHKPIFTHLLAVHLHQSTVLRTPSVDGLEQVLVIPQKLKEPGVRYR